MVEMYRTEQVTTYTQELVVVRCCVPATDAGAQQFGNAAATMIASVYLYPPLPIDYNLATGA